MEKRYPNAIAYQLPDIVLRCFLVKNVFTDDEAFIRQITTMSTYKKWFMI